MSWQEIDQEVAKIERNLKPIARSAQRRIRLFLAIYVPALATAFIAAHASGTSLTVSTLFSLAMTAAGEIDPSVPWSALTGVFDRSRTGTLPDVPPAKGSGT